MIYNKRGGDMFTCESLRRCKSSIFMVIWLAALLANPLKVWAGCTNTPNSEFNLLVDSSSSCEALSSNMYGCLTDSNGKCDIEYIDPVTGLPDGRVIHVVVNPPSAVGETPSEPGLVSWTATGPAELANNLVDFSILLGATQGGTCGWTYTPGANYDTGLAFLKSNGSYQKVNDIFFCSDFVAPPPAYARLVLSKTVMPEKKVMPGGEEVLTTCGVDDREVVEVGVGEKVVYCFMIENVGAGNAGDVALNDEDAGITEYVVGALASGEKTTEYIKSSPVPIIEAGQIVNTATVIGISSQDPALREETATDTAKVVAEQKLVLCPPEYQQLVEGTINQGEDGFDVAVLLDKDRPDLASICVPGEDSGATRTECVSECLPTLQHPACRDNSTSAECLALLAISDCQESGAWGNTATSASCLLDPAPAGTLPYCWEVIQDHDQDCVYDEVSPYKTLDFTFMYYRRNPFCYESCSGSGKKRSCETICF
jgi:hypothetical protein